MAQAKTIIQPYGVWVTFAGTQLYVMVTPVGKEDVWWDNRPIKQSRAPIADDIR